MANHYQYLASYTLSKAKDTLGHQPARRLRLHQIETLRRRRSAASAGRRAASSQLPAEVQVSTIADFRSSLRFAPTNSLDLNGDGYTSDLPAGVQRFSGCRGLDLSAVNAYRATRNLAPVTDTACPGFSNLDIRFSKFFTIGGAHRMELIAQLFNVFDRANLATPTTNITSALFGQSTTILPNIDAPSRQVELAIRYQF